MTINSVSTPSLIRLKPHIRNYKWGSSTILPNLVGMPITGEPVAELWYGAHPTGPALAYLPDGSEVDLYTLIKSDPNIAGVLDCLSFMVKLLSIESALSLQLHPDAAQAASGYSHEESARIALSAPKRTYKDPRPKPELLIAVTPCRVLAGLREPDAILEVVRSLGSPSMREIFHGLAPGAGLKKVLHRILTLSTETAARTVNETLNAINRLIAADSDNEMTRLGQLLQTLNSDHPGDRGILAALLCNDIDLDSMQALYVPPGILHSYVRGVAIEVMGNSDNVVRGGLTPKYVDVDALVNLVKTEPSHPLIMSPTGGSRAQYRTDAKEFQVEVISLGNARQEIRPKGPAIVLAISGAAELYATDCSLRLSRGDAAFVVAGATLEATGKGSIICVAPGS